MKIKISCKSITKQKKIVGQVIYQYSQQPQNVQELITETVKIMVHDYKERQEASDILKVLSKEEIANQSQKGKIGFGRIDTERTPDLEEAIKTALECFEDGLVVIFADGEKKEKLEDELQLKDESEITFVRMTMLSGRMW